MLAGHFGLAAVVKGREPQLPVWSLMLSTQLLDVLFVILYLLGLETYRAVPGTTGGYGNNIITADYSHSLVGALVIAVLAIIATTMFWGRRNGLIIGALAFSHWILDFIVHRGDLAILPGNAGALPRLGLGVWSIPALSIALELILVLAGAYMYYHAAMRGAVKAERQEAKSGGAQSGFRRQALWASVIMLVLLVGTLVSDVVGPG